jgi:hypothetical protein
MGRGGDRGTKGIRDGDRHPEEELNSGSIPDKSPPWRGQGWVLNDTMKI